MDIHAKAFSPSRLDRFRAIALREIERGYVPGVVWLVSRHGETHVEALGTLAFGSVSPMRRDTVFRLASMTKPVTAVAAMILVEECRLRLDDPVDDLLPELAHRRVLRAPDAALGDTAPARRPITVRDLLTYRSGYGEAALFAPGAPIHRAEIEAKLPLAVWPFTGTPDELMKRVGELPLAFQPGERWAYHLSGEILGVLVSRAAGKSLGAFMRERIFEPLGMKDTGFSVPEDAMDRFATCYRTNLTTGALEVADEPRTGSYAKPPAFEGGAGGLVSTIDDMFAFCEMLLNEGTRGWERILSRPTVSLMTTDHITPEQKAVSPFFPGFWETCGWGLGMGVFTCHREIGRSVGTFGWDGAFGTSSWVDPCEDLVGILMVQRTPASLGVPPLAADFWTSTYQAIDD